MKDLSYLDNRRSFDVVTGSWGDSGNGLFLLVSPYGDVLVVRASNGEGWDHVSVSRVDRCPWWEEMEHVRIHFFEDDETVMQLSVPRSEHLNCHPYCLHMWRPHNKRIPQPPAIMVAPA